MELTDKESHNIQNEIDQVMDRLLDPNLDLWETRKKLEEIRDSIPCSCGEEH